MFVSDSPHGLDSDLFSWDGTTPGNSETVSNTISPPHTTKDGAFNTMTMVAPGSKQPRTLAPNLTRRSHKKSRAGCYTCKTRKIKCGEQKPKCGNCLLKGLDCIYPSVDTSNKRKEPAIALTKRNVGGVTGSPRTASFSMLDMRFFHHFLTTAYPHLPLGNDHVWVNEIPQFAENHEYLMHAILSLGASHLSRLTGSDYRKESLTHRGQAIAGLNHALSMPARHYGESDAMLAACYALTFQASYMGDGLADFITMVRGCALTTAKIKQEDVPTAFNLQPNWHFKIMAPRLANLPRVNHRLLESGIEALEEVRPFLANEVDDDFHQALIDVLDALLESPQGGYLQFAGLYTVWYELCHDSFKHFLDPTNLPAQLLLSYFVALQMLMVPLAVYEWPDRADAAKARVLSGCVEWAAGIFARLRANADTESGAGSREMGMLRCTRWPRRIMAIVRREIGQVDDELDSSKSWGEAGEAGMEQEGMDQEADEGTFGLGLSVLKLGLPISPSVEGDAESQEEAVVVQQQQMVWDQDGGLARFWEEEGQVGVGIPGGVGHGDGLVDPVLVTTMGMDHGILTAASEGAPLPVIHGPVDLDMEMLG